MVKNKLRHAISIDILLNVCPEAIRIIGRTVSVPYLLTNGVIFGLWIPMSLQEKTVITMFLNQTNPPHVIRNSGTGFV
jgi:hypothetical protein